MRPSKLLEPTREAIAAFLLTAMLLGAVVRFAIVALLIGPHGAGVLPEWSNLPFIVTCAGGVGYVSFKVALWVGGAIFDGGVRER